MGDDLKNTQGQQASGGNAGTSGDPNAQIQEPKPQKDPASQPKVEKVYAEEQITELIEKARSDEKSKVFSKLEALKASNDEVQKKLEELENAKKEIEKDRDALREGRTSELKSVNEELAQLREQNEKLHKAFEASVETATLKIREQELKTYRAERLRAEKVEIEELVAGDSEEEIDKSIERALEKQKAIEERLREEIRKDLAKDLPKPVLSDGSQGRGPTPVITPQNRQVAARLQGDEYAKRRQELLQEAKVKAGWSS